MLQVEVIATEELGDRSYLAHDGQVAVVVDPQRDIDRVEALLRERGSPRLVVETHIHNDYVSGGYQLAARAGRATWSTPTIRRVRPCRRSATATSSPSGR